MHVKEVHVEIFIGLYLQIDIASFEIKRRGGGGEREGKKRVLRNI